MSKKMLKCQTTARADTYMKRQQSRNTNIITSLVKVLAHYCIY